MKLGRKLIKALIPMSAALLLLLSFATAQAEGETIRVLSSSVTSEFPEGIRFKVEASGDNEITSIAVRFKTGTQSRGSYDYLDLERGQIVNSELLWRTNTGARYIPPGTIITYNFEIEDSEGGRFDTEPETFVYHDIRFEWKEVSQGAITVSYHGPVKKRAEIILDALIETLDKMAPLLGADTSEPIRATAYNNNAEMLGALPPGSSTIRRELVTEGQAFTNIGTLLLIIDGRLARGTASHEMMHILTSRAGDSAFRGVPAWLNEGLSEFGNIDPGFSYDVALEFAMATDRLLPITSMPALPGNPEDVIIFYGQARSIVRFMVEAYGSQRMTDLMATLQSGTNMDLALRAVYGVDRLGLENQWRRALGAPLFTPSERASVKPTPIPRGTVTAYNLADLISGAAVTPTPEPTATAEPEPTITPQPEPTPTAQVVAQADTSPAAGSSSETSSSTTGEPDSQGGGGACSAPRGGGQRALDMSGIALVVGLVGLRFRRWFRRWFRL
ncbi:MAG: hypothetical protein IIC84_08235 [Chloroflexi bacterium]|nr:hypothetical protein [Chloroflexota bacterium]